MRARVGDKRVLALVKAFLKAGILSEDGLLRDNDTGTPQGSILSPLLSNVALSVLDEHIAQAPGGPGTDPQRAPEAPTPGSAQLPAGAVCGRLVPDGPRHQGRRRGAARRDRRGPLSDGPAPVAGEDPDHPHRAGPGLPRLAHPAPPQTRHQPVATSTPTPPRRPCGPSWPRSRRCAGRSVRTSRSMPCCVRLNPALRGWCAYFRPGVSSATFSYLQPLPVAHGLAMGTAQAPQDELEEDPPPLRRTRIMVGQREPGPVQPRQGRHHPLPLPGRSHPHSLGRHGMRTTTTEPSGLAESRVRC